VLKLTDSMKSLIINIVAAIIVSAASLVLAPYVPYLVEMKISLSMLIIIISIIAVIFSVIYSVQIHRMKKAKLSEPSRLGAKSFSCLTCGEPFEAFPPDDQHSIGSIDPSPTAISITYTCVNHHKNTIFWLSTKGVLL